MGATTIANLPNRGQRRIAIKGSFSSMPVNIVCSAYSMSRIRMSIGRSSNLMNLVVCGNIQDSLAEARTQKTYTYIHQCLKSIKKIDGRSKTTIVHLNAIEHSCLRQFWYDIVLLEVQSGSEESSVQR